MSKFSINSFDTLKQFLELTENERAGLTEISFDSMDGWFPKLSRNDEKFKAFCDSLLQCSALQTISDSANKQKSALWLAAYYERWVLINMLLQYATEGKYHLHIDLRPVEGPNLGTTPLWWSIYPGPRETVELLLLNGANINTMPVEGQHEGETPFWRAACYRRWDLVTLMMEDAEQKSHYVNFNASPRSGCDKGTTPLWWAAYDKQWALVTVMIKQAYRKGYHVNFDAGPTEGEHQGKTVFSLMSACVDELDLKSLLLMVDKTPENLPKLDVTVDQATSLKSLQDNHGIERSLLLNPEEEGKKFLLGFEKHTTEVTAVSPQRQPAQEVPKQRRKLRCRQSASSIHIMVT